MENRIGVMKTEKICFGFFVFFHVGKKVYDSNVNEKIRKKAERFYFYIS